MRVPIYRVRISSWIFELGCRVGFSSWIFELDFELDFRVRIFWRDFFGGFFFGGVSNFKGSEVSL